jgi:hypothetical protein
MFEISIDACQSINIHLTRKQRMERRRMIFRLGKIIPMSNIERQDNDQNISKHNPVVHRLSMHKPITDLLVYLLKYRPKEIENYSLSWDELNSTQSNDSEFETISLAQRQQLLITVNSSCETVRIDLRVCHVDYV